MRLLLGPVVASVLAVLATPAVAVPSYAETFRGGDPARDVQRLTRSGDGDDYTAAPTRANPDVLAATVRHTKRRVVIDVRFDDIFVPPGRTGVFAVFGDLRSDTSGASWDMWATQERRQGRVTIFRRGKRCLGSSRVDYARDTARVVLPRRCLGDPRWVRVSITAWSQDKVFVWEDRAFTAGFMRDHYTPRLSAG
jgi:hypothetical protein